MIVDTSLAIALRCPECEEQMLYRFTSLFALQKVKQLKFGCSCGYKPVAISLGSKGNCFLSLMGHCCEESHEFSFSLNELQEQNIFSLTCDLDDTHLAYFGLRGMVLDVLIDESMDLIEREQDLKKFFLEPRIVGEILTTVNKLAKHNVLYCEECGSHDLNIKINSGDIQLQCASCFATGELNTKTETHLEDMAGAEKILIHQKGLTIVLANEMKLISRQPQAKNIKKFR